MKQRSTNNLVIILGAGASYDYISNGIPSFANINPPPITKNLFRDSRSSISMQQYPEVKKLYASVDAAQRGGRDIEQYLSYTIKRSIRRKGQAIAFQFYLQSLFQNISHEIGNKSGNNYSALIENIHDSNRDTVIATFNYDTLLEQALYTKNISNMNSYILGGTIPLIKLHGSCNWAYPIDIPSTSGNPESDSYSYFMKNIELLDSIKFQNKNIIIRGDHTFSRQPYSPQDLKPYFPAIALPHGDKKDFMCPPNHLEVLKKALSKTKKILIIGWRAGDRGLVDLIKDTITNSVSVTIVSGSSVGRNEVIKKLKSISKLTFPDLKSRFSTFLSSSACTNLFAE